MVKEKEVCSCASTLNNQSDYGPKQRHMDSRAFEKSERDYIYKSMFIPEKLNDFQ